MKLVENLSITNIFFAKIKKSKFSDDVYYAGVECLDILHVLQVNLWFTTPSTLREIIVEIKCKTDVERFFFFFLSSGPVLNLPSYQLKQR